MSSFVYICNQYRSFLWDEEAAAEQGPTVSMKFATRIISATRRRFALRPSSSGTNPQDSNPVTFERDVNRNQRLSHLNHEFLVYILRLFISSGLPNSRNESKIITNVIQTYLLFIRFLEGLLGVA